jgi:hypothetical protein
MTHPHIGVFRRAAILRRIWPSLMLCTFLGGCAAPVANTQPAQTAQRIDKEPALDDDVLLLNPAGGQYSEFTQGIAVGKDYQVDLTLVHANPDPRWSSLATVCLSVKVTDIDTCFRFQVVKGTNDMELYKFDSTPGPETPAREPLDGVFHPGEVVHMRLRSEADGIVFSLNGGPPRRFATSGKANEMRVNCSSAFCRYRLRQE